MGLNCPNVRHVIHWGPPSTLESYIQETGQAGRDGEVSTATLYYCRQDLKYEFIEEGIREYCHNSETVQKGLYFFL